MRTPEQPLKSTAVKHLLQLTTAMCLYAQPQKSGFYLGHQGQEPLGWRRREANFESETSIFFKSSSKTSYFPRHLVPSYITLPVNCISTAGEEQERPNPKGSKGVFGDISLVKMLIAVLLRQLRFYKQIVESVSALGCLIVMILTFSFSALFRNLLSLLLLTTARSAEFSLQNSRALSMETCSLLI